MVERVQIRADREPPGWERGDDIFKPCVCLYTMSLEDWFHDIAALKHTERAGWVRSGVDQPRDTIASHSFGAALLGWFLADAEGVDVERVVKMALVHDLVMAHMPDITPEDDRYAEKRELEQEALDEVLAHAPASLTAEIEDLFEAFVAGETDEAQVAQEADKLDTLMQAKTYADVPFDEFYAHLEDVFATETGVRTRDRLRI